MNLQHLRYLIAFAENRTLTGAAHALGVSQPAISRALHELQEELQCVLFRRVGRRLELTAAGDVVLVNARRALAAVEDIRRVPPDHPLKDVLRIATFPSMAAGMSSVLQLFLRSRPNVKVQVVHAASHEQLVEMLRRRDVDLTYGEVVRPPRGMTLTPARPLEVVLASPPGTGLPEVVELKHLDKLPMICPPPTEERRRLLDGPCEEAGANLDIVLESADSTTFLSGIMSGIGSAVVWRVMADQTPGIEVRRFAPMREVAVGFVHHAKPIAVVRQLLGLVRMV